MQWQCSVFLYSLSFWKQNCNQKLSQGWYCRKLLFDHACYWISILIIKPSMFDLHRAEWCMCVQSSSSHSSTEEERCAPLEFRVEDAYVQAWFCDITTSLEPILLHFITYTSVIWKLDSSSAHTVRMEREKDSDSFLLLFFLEKLEE